MNAKRTHKDEPALPRAAEDFENPTGVPGAEEDGVNIPEEQISPEHRESIEADDSDTPDGSGPGTEADRTRHGRSDA